MNEFKPCPFCGGKARYYYKEEYKGEYGQIHKPEHHMYCNNGNCCAKLSGYTKEGTIIAWNTRIHEVVVEENEYCGSGVA